MPKCTVLLIASISCTGIRFRRDQLCARPPRRGKAARSNLHDAEPILSVNETLDKRNIFSRSLEVPFNESPLYFFLFHVSISGGGLRLRQSRVVYSFPMSCGKIYVGQTGRCVNDRLGEHALNLKKLDDKYAHLVAHVSSCTGCVARFEGTRILGKSKDKTARISLEAYHIKKLGSTCISTPSLSLFDAEFHLLAAACDQSAL